MPDSCWCEQVRTTDESGESAEVTYRRFRDTRRSEAGVVDPPPRSQVFENTGV
jgi:hypothetical protein